MKRQFNDFLKDILIEINIIKDATEEISFEEFKSNPILTRAISRSLEIIGEAVSNVPNEIKDKYSDVEWRKIKGFRDIITHRYWSIDLYYEWDIIKTKLDILENQIKQILKKEKISINKK